MKAALLSRSVLIALALAIAGCSKKPGPGEAAKIFFDQIAAGQTQAAYESAAFGFQAQQSLKFFETTAKEMGLDAIGSATFDNPEVEGRTAKVRAEFTPRNGPKFPLIVTLTRDMGVWRVYSLKSPRSLETGLVENRFSIVGKGPGFVDPVNRQPPPDDATMKKMILDTLLEFNAAVQEKSFSEFFKKLSRTWQNQLTENQLQRAFQPFIDKNVNIADIRKVEVVLDAPSQVSTEGLLLVSGEYPTKPYRVRFSLKFIYEVPKWKLFGIDVGLQK